MQYLSPEWIAAADEALAAAWQQVGDKGTGAVLLWQVGGAPEGKVTFTVRFGPSGAGFGQGAPDVEPDATLSLDYDTAVAIARGELSPQVAFMQGGLKLGGDVMVLVASAPGLAALGDAFAELRQQTEY